MAEDKGGSKPVHAQDSLTVSHLQETVTVAHLGVLNKTLTSAHLSQSIASTGASTPTQAPNAGSQNQGNPQSGGKK